MPTNIVTEQPITLPYVAVAGQTVFPFDFQIFEGFEDLVVEINGVETTAFEYSLVGDEGGQITLDVPANLNDAVVVSRVLDIERITQFPHSGPVAMESVNHELNRIVALIQQVASGRYATITLGTVTTGAPGTDVIITNSGTSKAAILNFTIPRGMPGTPGELGAWGGMTGNLQDQVDLWNYLQTLAPKDSPALTGNPTAPTPATSDSDTSIATTGFVKAAMDAERIVIIPINATAMTPRTTNGASPGAFETATNKIMIETLDFDASTIEYAQIRVPMIKSWDEGSLEVQLGWTATGTGSVMWSIAGAPISHGDALDTPFAGAVTLTDTISESGDLVISAYSSPVAFASPVENDMLIIQVHREAPGAEDTLAVDAKLLFIRLRFRVNKRDDA